jgi:hypothetical protein
MTPFIGIVLMVMTVVRSQSPIPDTCILRQRVASTNGSTVRFQLSTNASTSCGDVEICGNCSIAQDIWLEYTAPCTGLVRVDTCLFAGDSSLQLFVDACPATRNEPTAAQLNPHAASCDDFSEYDRYFAASEDFSYGCGLDFHGESAVVRVTAGQRVIARVGLYEDSFFFNAGDVIDYEVQFMCQNNANDVCAARAPLPVLSGAEYDHGVVLFGNDMATTCNNVSEICPDTCSMTKDLWFSYRADCTGLAMIEFCSGVANLARMELFKGGCPTSGAQRSVNGRHECETEPYLCHSQQVFVAAGDEIVLHVGAVPDEAIQLFGGGFSAHCVPGASEPANNECWTAEPVVGGGANSSAVTAAINTTYSTSCASCGACLVPRDVWYAVKAPCSGQLWIDACSAVGLFSYPPMISATRNASCPSPASVGSDCGLLPMQKCEDDAFVRGRASIAVAANDLVNVRVGSLDALVGNVTFTCVSAPINDVCRSATAFLANDTAPVNNTLATTCYEGQCGFCNIERDLWYTYEANCTGVAIIDTCSIAGDTELSLHRHSTAGCALGSRDFNDGGVTSCNDYDAHAGDGGLHVGCGNDALGERAVMQVVAGEKLIVRVGSHRANESVVGTLHAMCVADQTLPPTTTTTAPTTAATTTPPPCAPCHTRASNGECVSKCAPILCSNLVAGWLDATCEAFATNSDSACNEATNQCAKGDEVAYCVGLETVPIVSCADVKCVDRTACQRGAHALGSSTTAAICSTGLQAECGQGFLCSSRGECVPVTQAPTLPVAATSMAIKNSISVSLLMIMITITTMIIMN